MVAKGQGKHGKLGKGGEKYSLQGKIREFENFAEIWGISGNFMKIVK